MVQYCIQPRKKVTRVGDCWFTGVCRVGEVHFWLYQQPLWWHGSRIFTMCVDWSLE